MTQKKCLPKKWPGFGRRTAAKSAVKNQKGLTLVELIVSAALLGLLSAAVVALINPFSNVFMRIQRLNEAQQIADTVLDDVRTQLLDARATVRLCCSGTDDPDAVFGAASGGYNAVEFEAPTGQKVLLDAGALPAVTELYDKDGERKRTEGANYPNVDGETGASRTGTLHLRYYVEGEAGRVFRDYADLHGSAFYMGCTVSLEFEPLMDGALVTALKTTVRVWDGETLRYETATTLDLPYTPALC